MRERLIAGVYSDKDLIETSSRKARLLRTLVAGTDGGALGALSRVGGDEAGREVLGGEEERIQGGEEGSREWLMRAASREHGGGGEETAEAQSDWSGGRSGILLQRLVGDGGGGGAAGLSRSVPG